MSMIGATVLYEKRIANIVLTCFLLLKSSPYCNLFFCVFLVSTMLHIAGCKKEDYPPESIKPVSEWGELEPAFSPDGKVIAYSSEGEIWLLEVATENSTFLTNGRLPDWSPDGRWIVYTRGRDIYKIDIETKKIKKLTTWGDCFFPDWSPNGRRIALDTGHEDPKGAHMIWLMDTNGTNFKDISIHGTGEWREPDWSPSGKELVHIRYVDVAASEIFIMDSTGDNSMRLTDNQVDDDRPAWSPDGAKIAYVKGTSSANIFLMNADGTNKVQLTFEPETCDGWRSEDPAWSPDGNQIVYTRVEWFEDDEKIELIHHLWIMDADGSNKRQLTGDGFD